MTTERATMVLSNKGALKPAAVLFRGQREPLGDPSGIWGNISVHGERYWVHRRFHGSVRLANEFLSDSAPLQYPILTEAAACGHPR